MERLYLSLQGDSLLKQLSSEGEKEKLLFYKWLNSLLQSHTVNVQEIRQHCFVGLFRHGIVDL